MTDKQKEALIKIVQRYRLAVNAEQERWGIESAKNIAARGIIVSDIHRRILDALHEQGFLELAISSGTSSSLRRGAYGRWIGGTKSTTYTTQFWKPTAKALAFYREHSSE